MDIEYISNQLPTKLAKYLEANAEQCLYRRRAVLSKGNQSWSLICCTVEGFLPGEPLPEAIASREYDQAILYEDLLTASQCLAFASELHEGRATFGNIELQGAKNSQWTSEAVPICNNFMSHAGCVVGRAFGKKSERFAIRTMLAPGQPYYPDIDTASRDWLPFPIYHGDSDGRNDQVLFLLPETRAFITNAGFSEGESLNIQVSGANADELPLLIKGAYWIDRTIHHFEAAVSKANAVASVPINADRIEYFLIDLAGTVYDFHREDRFSRFEGRGILGSAPHTLTNRVRQACHDGEGQHVEFKPFVSPDQPLVSNNQKTKLGEVVTTAVAFANAGGGNIFLGVDDDCHISGIDQKFCEWAKGPVDPASTDRYLGLLKSKIKDVVQGEITLSLSHVQLDGVIVVVIEIPSATTKPVAVQQDFYCYARSGASNKKVPPHQWKDIIDAHPNY